MYDFEQKPELNITPLVDVMLVLLAILMVTAPVIDYEENINLPQGSKSQKVQSIKKLEIQVTNKKIIYINKKKFSFKTFGDDFNLYAKDKDRKLPIYIRADKNLKYNDVMLILKSIKEAGFFKVSLVTDS
jgi:biopolymer transport protein ExbD